MLQPFNIFDVFNSKKAISIPLYHETFETGFGGFVSFSESAELTNTAEELSVRANGKYSAGGCVQSFTVEIGVEYRITADLRNDTADDVRYRVNDGGDNLGGDILVESDIVTANTNTTVSDVFIAISEEITVYLRVAQAVDGIGIFDNITIKKL